MLYRLPEVKAAIAESKPVFVTEGEKDADALVTAGSVATWNAEGAAQPGQAPKWRKDYSEQLRGAIVTVIADKDDAGRAHAEHIVKELTSIAAYVRLVEPLSGKDAYDHLAAGHHARDFAEVGAQGQQSPPDAKPIKLDAAHAVFKRWLGDDYDLGALDAVLAGAAVERLDGDPLWLLIISSSGNTKTRPYSRSAVSVQSSSPRSHPKVRSCRPQPNETAARAPPGGCSGKSASAAFW
jgi:hypothetical protein